MMATIQFYNKVVFVLFYIILAGCNSSTDNTEKVNDVIYKLIQADNASDLENVLNCYTDSIEFYPTGKEFTKGINKIRTSYEKIFNENKLMIQTQIQETQVFGNTAMITGSTRVNKNHCSIHPRLKLMISTLLF